MSYANPPVAHNQPIQTIAVGASPFIWQNTNPFPVKVLIFGGTLSAMSMSRDGSTYDPYGLGASIIPLNPGEYVAITYLLIPSAMYVIPG